MSAPWWSSDYKDTDGPEYRIHVSNLPWRTDDSSLKEAFADYRPRSAEVACDRETGRSRGYGFVNLPDEKSMRDAIQGKNGQELGDRNITVDQANQRARRWRA